MFTKHRKSVLVCAAAAVLALTSINASAAPITITSGNAGGNGTTDNVLFNDSTLLHSGVLVQGNFSGVNSIYTIDFTSTSGTNLLMGSGGQATISGLAGNDPFTNLTFGLENGATFTNAILNIDADHNGSVEFLVNYMLLGGSSYQQLFTVGQNGSNFFHIDAASGVVITSVSVTGQGVVKFSDVDQVRIGGFSGVNTPPTVPEPASMLLFGMGLIGAGARWRRGVKSSA